MPKSFKKIILASASPRRKHLMQAAGYRFRIIPSHVSERYPPGLRPFSVVRYLALKKARAVARKYPRDIILGADTLVFINGRVIGKPRNLKHACRILKQLAGRWQKVCTGVAIVWDGGRRTRTGTAQSLVKMRRMTEDEIRRAASRNLDKAGAYAVQEKKDPLVVRIVGDYDNVVGLPLRVVRKLLRGLA